MAQTTLAYIPITKIQENPNALREVSRGSEDYMELVDSVRKQGVMNPILVRECKDPKTGEDFYGLIDGLHRFSAARDAGLTEVPANITSMQDADTMLAQIMANVHRVETKPGEYSKQLVRILALQPLLTLTELAGTLSKSITWLNDRLGLVKLNDAILKLVDEDKINLSNAYGIAKLAAISPEEQTNYVDRAIAMTPAEFLPIVNERIKELRDAKRQGRNPNPEQFVAHPRIRKMSELTSALNDPQNAKSVLEKNPEAQDVVTAFMLGVKWTTQMDAESVQLAKERDDARKRDAQEKKDAAKRERQAQKEREASEKQHTIQQELETAKAPEVTAGTAS